ncbi:MAG: hypothetical protein U5N56_01095 [Candidatus Marinimicrobia bacterium]|nr:hypothetical protein [Candidatus Neomarinimicrobiota bacterium]
MTREENPIRERKKMERLSGARPFCILANAEGFVVRQLAEEKRRSFFCLLFFGPAKKEGKKDLFRSTAILNNYYNS